MALCCRVPADPVLRGNRVLFVKDEDTRHRHGEGKAGRQIEQLMPRVVGEEQRQLKAAASARHSCSARDRCVKKSRSPKCRSTRRWSKFSAPSSSSSVRESPASCVAIPRPSRGSVLRSGAPSDRFTFSAPACEGEAGPLAVMLTCCVKFWPAFAVCGSLPAITACSMFEKDPSVQLRSILHSTITLKIEPGFDPAGSETVKLETASKREIEAAFVRLWGDRFRQFAGNGSGGPDATIGTMLRGVQHAESNPAVAKTAQSLAWPLMV